MIEKALMNQTPFQAFKLETFFFNGDLKPNGLKKGAELETFLKKVQKKLVLKKINRYSRSIRRANGFTGSLDHNLYLY